MYSQLERQGWEREPTHARANKRVYSRTVNNMRFVLEFHESAITAYGNGIPVRQWGPNSYNAVKAYADDIQRHINWQAHQEMLKEARKQEAEQIARTKAEVAEIAKDMGLEGFDAHGIARLQAMKARLANGTIER